MNKSEIYKKAVQQWGKPMQIIMALEEMAELSKELTKNLRGKENDLQVCEEIADVEIMMEQLRVIFNKYKGKDNAIDMEKETKLCRLKGLIEANPTAKDVVEGR